MLSPCVPFQRVAATCPAGFQHLAHDQHPEATGGPSESTADPCEISGRRLGRKTVLSFENSWDSTHFTYICVKIYIYVYIQDGIYQKKFKGIATGKRKCKTHTQKMRALCPWQFIQLAIPRATRRWQARAILHLFSQDFFKVHWFRDSEKAMALHSSTLAGKSHGGRSLVGCSPWGR